MSSTEYRSIGQIGIKLAMVVITPTVAKIPTIPGSGNSPLVAMSKSISSNAIVTTRNNVAMGVKWPFLFFNILITILCYPK